MWIKYDKIFEKHISYGYESLIPLCSDLVFTLALWVYNFYWNIISIVYEQCALLKFYK